MGKTNLRKNSVGRESVLPFGAVFNALVTHGFYQRDQFFFAMRKTIGRIFSVGGWAADGHDLYTGIADHIV